MVKAIRYESESHTHARTYSTTGESLVVLTTESCFHFQFVWLPDRGDGKNEDFEPQTAR